MTHTIVRLVAGALVVAAVATRFAGLGSKPMHHDEAIHAWLSRDIARGAGYEYNPVYHGPVLYHLEALVFAVAGTGEFRARAVPAAFGVLAVWLAFTLLRRRLGDAAALAAAFLVLVSPTLTYYSRFNSHDILMVVFTIAMTAIPFEYAAAPDRRLLVWLATVLGLAVSTKLNAYFVVGALAVYFALYVAFARAMGRPLFVWRFVQAHRSDFVKAAAFGAAVVAVAYETTFIHRILFQKETVAGAARTTMELASVAGFRHWTEMHRIQRVGGPFHFYLPILAVYEPLAVGLAIGALFYYMRRRARFVVALAALVAIEIVGLSRLSPGSPVLQALRMERWHVVLASAWALGGAWTVVSLWLAERGYLACWVFLGVAELLLYSYAGEKVPWLAAHVLLPWLVVSAAFAVEAWGRVLDVRLKIATASAAVALLILTLHGSWVLNTTNRSNVAEPMVQVEYTDDVRRTVEMVRALGGKVPDADLVRIEGPVQWPFAWYLRDARVSYVERVPGSETVPVLIAAFGGAHDDELALRYEGRTLAYYRWGNWVDKLRAGDIRGLLRFMVFHRGWGEDTSVPFRVWIRKDLRGLASW